MKNILVTGGVGFIGSNLIKVLIDQGFNVTSVDDYSSGLKSNEVKGAKYINLDIESIDKVDGKFDLCIHLAAKSRVQPSFKAPTEYFRVNVQGTMQIMEWAKKNKVKVVYAGSSSKHHDPYQSPYALYKYLGEEICKMYKQVYQMDVEIARFYNVYGPYQLTEGSYTTLIGRWLNNIEKGIDCEIYGDGDQRRDFTHVDDIVDALIRIQKQQAYRFIFELGRGKNHSVNEIAKMLNINPTYKPAKLGEARNTLNTDTSAQSLLGWEPKINLEDYLTSYL